MLIRRAKQIVCVLVAVALISGAAAQAKKLKGKGFVFLPSVASNGALLNDFRGTGYFKASLNPKSDKAVVRVNGTTFNDSGKKSKFKDVNPAFFSDVISELLALAPAAPTGGELKKAVFEVAKNGSCSLVAKGTVTF